MITLENRADPTGPSPSGDSFAVPVTPTAVPGEKAQLPDYKAMLDLDE
ncbi:hypothetical protein [Plasticicumulans lactativorans]|nr:hypothetical protein [Plasticicumulans lactativorans]